MRKVTSWLKTCFGFKKNKAPAPAQEVKEKEKEEEENSMISNSGGGRRDTPHITAAAAAEQSKHAIAVAVAAATVAAAEAAIASAVAAITALRRRTSQSRVTPLEIQNWAAIKIQSVYRGHLARRARRALKSVVKVQALFRGYLVRKKVAATLQRMQALVRAQAYVHAHKTLGCFYSIQAERSKWLSRSRSCSSRALHPRDDLNGKVPSSRWQCPQLPPRLSLHDCHLNSQYSGRGLVGENTCPRYMAETESYRAKINYITSLRNAIEGSIMGDYVMNHAYMT